ncbi:MAG: LEA type 2 family protein [Salinivirgaceae bacterium]|jgi:LEA14-like dessication related protein|nr:LEA type 2 family protein [Salinivirgaceae bacterium]
MILTIKQRGKRLFAKISSIKKATVVVLGVLIISLSSCSLVKPVEFKGVNSFSIEEKGGKVYVTTNISLYNPNGFKLTIYSADIDVVVDGVNLGKLEIPDQLIINKKGVFSGNFKVEISIVKLLVAGRNILATLKSDEVKLQLNGIINTDLLWMNKTFKVNFNDKLDLKR